MDIEYKNSKGKVVGTLFSDGKYRKKVDSTLHKMKMFNGYGIDKNIVTKLKEAGCNEIRILETDTNIIYSIRFESFEKNSIEKNFDGLQLFIPIKFCQSSNIKQPTLI